MILPDTNVLVYLADESVRQHRAAKSWMEAALSGNERVGLAWTSLLGFLRISTHPRLFARPLKTGQAWGMIKTFLASPVTEIIHPGPEHALLLERLLDDAGTAGNLVSDAHLAALAIEHGAELYSFDRDFGRFEGLRWKLLK